ncbi:MAG TPA: GDYXXLXY domain-containing protein, partial [Saprospiraceae bacterium]|nr:GDYXXLXY domain-containing protein [Saprospiraceae bacterium]
MIKIILPIAFAIMVLVQLYVPASMIMESEKVLKEGKEFKFKTAPVDPTDPFRGKYVELNFDAINFRGPIRDTFNYGEMVYVS